MSLKWHTLLSLSVFVRFLTDCLAMDESQLVSSFDALISSFDKETKVLKCISSMRGLTEENCPENIQSQFDNLEGSLTDIEKRVADLDNYLDSELHSLSELKKLNDLIQCQTQGVEKTLENTPACFKLSTAGENVPPVMNGNGSTNAPAAATAVVPMVASTHTTINEAAFQRVATATRGRHTLQSINVAWLTINKLFESKHKKAVIAARSQQQNSVKSSSNVLVPSVSSTYLTESELRGTSIYEIGSSSGNAIMQTLRALGLVRVLRQQKETCYYKC